MIPLASLWVLALCLLAPSAAQGGTIRDDVSDSQYISLGNSFPDEAEVSWVESGSSYLASGTYIGDGWILTAAHVTDGTDFQGGGITRMDVSVNGIQYSVDHTVTHPGWVSTAGNLKSGDDIALIKLTQDITTVAPAQLYRGTGEKGQIVTSVGYGCTGTGLTGYDPNSAGTRRAGQNTIDLFGGDLSASELSTYSSNILFMDFDSPTKKFLSSWGDRTPLPLEYLIAPGDSGGGSFIQSNGKYYLAGVTSFLTAMKDTTIDASYGDAGGLTRVSSFVDWIDQTTAIPPFLRGDANQDGKVTFSDYLTLEQNFGKTSGMTCSTGDFNADGKVSFSDYLLLEQNFGRSIPEPASLTLLGLGGLALLKRRK